MSGLPILLGDSIFRRLLERHPSLFDPLSHKFCIGGQRIEKLFEGVRGSRAELKGRKVVILIGTNDILGGTSSKILCKSFRDLFRYLKRLECHIAVCEVLPIPRLGKSVSLLVNDVNKYLRSFEPSGVNVIHTFSHFSNALSIYEWLYEKWIYKNNRKSVDLVHPNADGLECLLICIEV